MGLLFSMSVAPAVRLWSYIRMPFRDTPLAGLGCPEGAQVGSGVSEVLRALGASLATMWRNHDDRAVRLDIVASANPNGRIIPYWLS
jgi:hypothetical protein